VPAARPSPRRSPDPPVPDDPVPYDPDKLAELMLLAAEGLQTDPTYGATKLNKALFFGDFLHHKRHGRPISGAAYQRLPRAPAPRDLLAVRRGLCDRGEAAVETRAHLGHVQQRLLPLRPPRQEVFEATEVQVVAEVCDALRGHSHANVLGWQLAAEREDIPYESAFLSTSTPARADIERALALADERGLLGPGPAAGIRPAGSAAPPDQRVLRTVSYECPVGDLLSSYPRAGEVLAGIEWACARWPDGIHRIPGTRLHLLKTEWPVPSLRAWFSLDD